jgi:hypothetical protein
MKRCLSLLLLACVAFTSPRQTAVQRQGVMRQPFPSAADMAHAAAATSPPAPPRAQQVFSMAMVLTDATGETCLTNERTGKVYCVTPCTNCGPGFTGTNVEALNEPVPAQTNAWGIAASTDLARWTPLVTYPTGGSKFWTFGNTGRVTFTDQSTNSSRFYTEFQVR